MSIGKKEGKLNSFNVESVNMNLDFSEIFKGFSTRELLIILKQPENYQKNACEAASQALEGRQISKADLIWVDSYIKGNLKRKDVRVLLNNYIRKTEEHMELIIKPGNDFSFDHWLKLILVMVALQFAWNLYHVIIIVNAAAIHSQENLFNPYFLLKELSLVYLPIMFYFILKRAWVGWVILFSDNCILLILELGQLYILLYYNNVFHGNMNFPLLIVFSRLLLGFFLWRKTVANTFKATKQQKILTLFVAIFISLLLIGIWRLHSS